MIIVNQTTEISPGRLTHAAELAGLHAGQDVGAVPGDALGQGVRRLPPWQGSVQTLHASSSVPPEGVRLGILGRLAVTVSESAGCGLVSDICPQVTE